MAMAFSLICLLVSIQHSSASTSQPNMTNQYPTSSLSNSILLSTSSSLKPSSPLSSSLSSSSLSSSPSSSPLQSSMISSTQSPSNWSTSNIIRPSSNSKSLSIISSFSPDSLSWVSESLDSSMSFEVSEIYITTEEIWASTLDPVIPTTSALPPSSSYHNNASHSQFPVPSPPPVIPSPFPSSSSGAISGTSNRTTLLYPQPSASSLSYEYDRVMTTVASNSSSVFASSSSMLIASHPINGSSPTSATPSTLHAPDITSSLFNSNTTSVVESHTVSMTASVNMSATSTSTATTVQSNQLLFSNMNMTATPAIYPTSFPTTMVVTSSGIPSNASSTDYLSVVQSTQMFTTSTAATVSQSPLPGIPSNASSRDSLSVVQSTQMFSTSTAATVSQSPLPGIPSNVSLRDSLSAMPSTPMFATSTAATVSQNPLPEVNLTNATLDDYTTLPIQYVSVQCTLVLGGDCRKVLAKEDAFKKNFTKAISDLISLDSSRILVNDVKCGSVVVNFTLEDTAEGDYAKELSGFRDTGGISVHFDDQIMLAEKIVIHNGPFAVGPMPSDAPPVSDGDGRGLTFEQQQRLIYILISVVVGFVILLAIILVVHHVARKTCRKSTQSFDLQDEPCIKLTDFNMAHTCIPRPRSIYSSIGADGRFFRYDNQEDVGNPPASPTSFIYADSRDIKEHYHEVVDPNAHNPLTSGMENQQLQDFGRSGLPEWNLPLIDGAPPVTSSDLLNTVDSQHSSQPSTSSDTFRPPSTASSTLNHPPVFSPPAPPAPPPPPLPTPVVQSGTLRSRQSCDASSEMTDSSGDTNTLTKGSSDVGTSMMGIDNPLMTPEEDYDIPGPSTSGRMSKYIVR